MISLSIEESIFFFSWRSLYPSP